MVDFILRHGNDLLAVECLRGLEVMQHGGVAEEGVALCNIFTQSF